MFTQPLGTFSKRGSTFSPLSKLFAYSKMCSKPLMILFFPTLLNYRSKTSTRTLLNNQNRPIALFLRDGYDSAKYRKQQGELRQLVKNNLDSFYFKPLVILFFPILHKNYSKNRHFPSKDIMVGEIVTICFEVSIEFLYARWAKGSLFSVVPFRFLFRTSLTDRNRSGTLFLRDRWDSGMFAVIQDHKVS